MAASQKATWEAPSFAELPKLVSPTTNKIWVRTRSRSPSSRLSPAGPLEGIAHYSAGGAPKRRRLNRWLRSVILGESPPKGACNARTPLYDSPRDRGRPHCFEGRLSQGSQTPSARSGSSSWGLLLVGDRKST